MPIHCNTKKLLESLQDWQAYARWANTFKLRKRMEESIKQQHTRIILLKQLEPSRMTAPARFLRIRVIELKASPL